MILELRRIYIVSILSALAVLIPALVRAEAVIISQVRPSALLIEGKQGDAFNVQFELSQPAVATLQIYDGRDLLIREVRGEQFRGGENAIAWDLRDHVGKLVPAEAYTYALEAKNGGGEVTRYDLADLTSGALVAARDVKLNPESGEISYVLDRPSRVSVRLGLNEGGPLLRTLVDWVVRPAGQQHESWDGKDASQILDLLKHPRLVISVEAFALPDNSVIIGGPKTRVSLVEKLPDPRHERPKSAAAAKRMFDHSQQPLEERGDFRVRLVIPDSTPRTVQGVAIAASPIAVRLEVDDRDRARALARRFEPVFFVDGQFAFENEVGFVPMTWNFDPSALNEGEHYLTVNLRGYEGNFGMATTKIVVKRRSQ